ncbi:MAG: MvaI/BcnI family restriction endonuclease [Mollicutes bacterium PWAP]|nr:MvaI/BcnI family restriction endonuclease [Mollicutes bacterium PWAP]
MKNIYTLEEIIKDLIEIKHKGWIKSLFPRNKNGGAGNTLENLLGIDENNISAPDLGDIELKTINIDKSNSQLLSLFNFDNKVWKMKQLDAIEKYGSKNKNGRMGLYYTLNTKPNSAGLFINADEINQKIIIQHVSGEILIEYPVENLVNKFNTKVQSVFLVYFKKEKRDGEIYFLYEKAKYLNGGTTTQNIISNIKNHIITIDLRLHPKLKKNGTSFSSRNHGTTFRVKNSNLKELYKKMENIDLQRNQSPDFSKNSLIEIEEKPNIINPKKNKSKGR